jgi:hypothetical protein
MMRQQISVFFVLVLVAGCQSNSVSESQCLAGDWQSVGYRDGVYGRRSTELLEHQNACVKHGIYPDRTEYLIGWERGIREYCEPDNAYAVGERGVLHNNICPADQREAFLAAYSDGRQLYLARVDVANLEQLIAQREYRLEQVKAGIVGSAMQQIEPGLPPQVRADLLLTTQRLSEEKGRIETELPQLRQQLFYKTQQLAALQQ